MTISNNRYTYDNALLLKDAGLVAASAAATVGGVAKVLDLGAPGFGSTVARVNSRVIIDVSAVETDTGDEKYLVALEASNDSTFATGKVVLAERAFGAATQIGASAASGTGRYEMPFTNDLDGTVYEFVRIHVTVTGTVATGINFTAYLAKE